MIVAHIGCLFGGKKGGGAHDGVTVLAPERRAQPFGDVLRQLRLGVKLTQLRLMFRLHDVGYLEVVPSTIANWELGYRLPNADVVYFLAEALGLKPDEERALLDVWVAELVYRNLKVYWDLKGRV